MGRSFWSTLILVGWLSLTLSLSAQQIHVMAKSGDPVPGGGTLFLLSNQTLTRAPNQVAFVSRIDLPGEDLHGLFRAEVGVEGLEEVVRENDPAPDGNGNFPRPVTYSLQMNKEGGLAFYELFQNTLGVFLDTAAILTAEPGGTLELVLRSGEEMPGGEPDDVFYPVFGPYIGFNDAGQVAFYALDDPSDTYSLWRGSTTPGSLTRIVTERDPAPNGSGIQDGQFIHPAAGISLNNSGQVAFYNNVILPGPDYTALFLGSGGTPVELVRSGDPTPSGNGTFGLFNTLDRIHLNDAGEVAFNPILNDTSGGAADNRGLFLASSSGLVELLRRGDPAPDGNGSFLLDSFAGATELAFNNRGQIAIGSNISGAASGASDGVFLVSPSGVQQIARLNEAAPGGGTFEAFTAHVALNERGDVAFWALVDTGQFNPVLSIFFYRDGVLTCAVREGDAIGTLGAITDLLVPDPSYGEPERSYLNDWGQIAFRAFTGGGAAVGLWSPENQVFADSFESGDVEAWSQAVGF